MLANSLTEALQETPGSAACANDGPRDVAKAQAAAASSPRVTPECDGDAAAYVARDERAGEAESAADASAERGNTTQAQCLDVDADDGVAAGVADDGIADRLASAGAATTSTRDAASIERLPTAGEAQVAAAWIRSQKMAVTLYATGATPASERRRRAVRATREAPWLIARAADYAAVGSSAPQS